jgi:hypothetical protein
MCSLSDLVEGCDIVFQLDADTMVSLGANDTNSAYQQNLLIMNNLRL